MANQETAFGLRPIGLVGNGVNSTGVTQYEIASNNTNPIFQFSLCVPTAAGVIDHAGATSGGTTPALGVLMGVEYVDSGTKKVVFKNYWPGSNNVSVDTNFPVKAFVADNPNQLLEAFGKNLPNIRHFLISSPNKESFARKIFTASDTSELRYLDFESMEDSMSRNNYILTDKIYIIAIPFIYSIAIPGLAIKSPIIRKLLNKVSNNIICLYSIPN